MKTQQCDECKHGTMRALPKPTLVCAMLHKPRFYAPVYFQRDTWGWKRKCDDFLQVFRIAKSSAPPCPPTTS